MLPPSGHEPSDHILRVFLKVEVKVVLGQLGIDDLFLRVISKSFIPVVVEFLLDSPIGRVGVVKHRLIKTGEKSKLDVDFHTHII